MRILHVVHTPRYSGAEMLVLALTNMHAEMGHQSAVVAMFPAEDAFETKINEQKKIGIEWFVPKIKLNRIARIKHLRRLQQDFLPDVTFAHSVLPAAYMRISGVGTIIPVLHAEDNHTSIDLILSEYFLQFFSKGVITVSPISKNLYQNRYKFPEVQCIPNGINVGRYKNEILNNTSSLVDSLCLPKDVVIALQVGRLSNIKQQYLSVRAIAAIVANNPKVHLLLAGLSEDAESVANLRQEIEKFGLHSNVHLIGSRDDIPALLQLARVYLMPSRQESQGIALIEGLASGVEIIASDIDAFKYAGLMSGVTLLNPNAIDEYSNAINIAISREKRYERNMTDYDIEVTAKEYVNFSKKFC